MAGYNATVTVGYNSERDVARAADPAQEAIADSEAMVYRAGPSSWRTRLRQAWERRRVESAPDVVELWSGNAVTSAETDGRDDAVLDAEAESGYWRRPGRVYVVVG